MKRILAMILVLVLLLTTGCTRNGDTVDGPDLPDVVPEVPQEPAPEEPDEVPEQPHPDEPEKAPQEPAPEAPQTPADPGLTTKALRRQLKQEGKSFAVAYLGNLSYDSSALWDFLENRTFPLTRQLAFLTEIPEENMIGRGGRGEVYALIFADPATQLQICSWTDTDGSDPVYDDVVFEGTAEKPLLLVCNADFSSDTLVNIGGTSTWHPRLDENLFVDGGDLLDVTPYADLQLEQYKTLIGNGWEVPAPEDLQKTGWLDDGYNRMGNHYLWQMELDEQTMDVSWNVGNGDRDQTYAGADWRYEVRDGIGVMRVDFGTFAGVKTYNLLLNREEETLYIAVDATDGEVDRACRYRFLGKRWVRLEPMDLWGAWERVYTNGPDGRVPSEAGQCRVIITGSDEVGYQFTYYDRQDSAKTLEEIAVLIMDGNTDSTWIAIVNRTGPNGLIRVLSLSKNGELVIQNSWTENGETFFSHEYFKRA